jgi:hypothetical protein
MKIAHLVRIASRTNEKYQDIQKQVFDGFSLPELVKEWPSLFNQLTTADRCRKR